ncbi:hypothetical protein HPB48_013477 [Haemaphysalis longicornis]|uniref:Uncharacterized protein n=1 Tax=Haemaphysalis longicornis TaxID=44386 RepID=A0A9J6GNK5_HAELO|nr:hypothetical protein HPB48_013477 [Haemaphysalis longicornis]
MRASSKTKEKKQGPHLTRPSYSRFVAMEWAAMNVGANASVPFKVFLAALSAFIIASKATFLYASVLKLAVTALFFIHLTDPLKNARRFNTIPRCPLKAMETRVCLSAAAGLTLNVLADIFLKYGIQALTFVLSDPLPQNEEQRRTWRHRERSRA